MKNIKRRKILEDIERDLWKRIQAIWDVKDPSRENFDPLVRLIVGACAYELKNISDDLYSSQDRILERLAVLMAPDTYTNAKPATTVMHLCPQEPEVLITPEFQATINREVELNDALVNKEITFSPAGHFKLFNATIQMCLFDNGDGLLNSIEDKLIYSGDQGDIEPHTIWLGMHFDKSIESIEELTLFVNWLNASGENIELKKSLFRTASCTLSQQKLLAENGLTSFGNAQNSLTSTDSQFDISQYLEQETQEQYHKSFVTYKMEGKAPIFLRREKLPDSLANSLKELDMTFFREELVWLEIQLSDSVLSKDFTSEMVVKLNCFPAFNRRIHSAKYKLSEHLNIFPLETQDQFFAIKKVTDTQGAVFKELPNIDYVSSRASTFCLRHGNVQRFDSRQSQDLIEQLIRSMRDDWASYTSMGKDEIRHDLTTISQALSRIQNRLGAKTASMREPWFLMLNADPEQGPGWNHVTISFWSTAGVFGNAIAASELIPVNHQFALNMPAIGAVESMLPTVGGKNAKTQNEQINAYKKAIVTRDRVVTTADIKAVCFDEYSDFLQDVEVCKGIIHSPENKSGLIRSLDVKLTFKKETQLAAREKDSLCHELKNKLQAKSNGLLPLRVMA